MKLVIDNKIFGAAIVFAAVGLGAGCGAQTGNGNLNTTAGSVNSNVNAVTNSPNSNANNANQTAVSAVVIDAKEPAQYQATVKIQLQATGKDQNTNLPAITAQVAKNTADRMMELTLPTGEKLIYIDKDGTNYAILPKSRQYAEITKETVGVDVRRLLMPEQIVQQVKNLKGFNLVGEENVNGRPALKYSYQATAGTQTQAGNVETQSFVLVDKETGLPLHSETVSQSQSGANVQGISGLRLATDLTDIKTEVDPSLFNVPTDYQKVDSAQIKSQADLLFRVAGTFLAQMMQSSTGGNGASANTNTAAANPNTNSSANTGGK